MNNITFKNFIENFAEPKVKNEFRTIGIIGYILAGINLVISILFAPIGIIDVIWIAGLSMGIHLGKSRACAIIFLILGIITFIVSTIQRGAPSGYWIPLLGLSAVIQFNKAHKLYKSFLQQQQQQPQQFYY